MTATVEVREEIYGGLRIVREDGENRCYVKVWTGKAQRFDYIAFRSVERREAYITERKEAWDAAQARKAERATARKAFDATTVFKVGDIIQSSWGWEQTNVDFYEVIAVAPKTVTLQEIGAKTVPGKSTGNSMADFVVPDTSWRGEITKHHPTSESIKFEDWKYGHKTTGAPTYRSWYA